MYTIDDREYNEFEEENENSFWSNNKGLIIKIIIIILCIIVLIWLFKALKIKKNTTVSESTNIENMEKVRLAAEDYFFIKNNKNNESIRVVNLNELKKQGLITDIIDSNKKVCSEHSSNVTLTKETSNYKMTIKLDCSTNEQIKDYYYNNNTLVCLNCNGDSKTTNIDKNTEIVKNEEPKKEDFSNKSDDSVVEENNDYSDYSCVEWTDWSKERKNDPILVERVKTLVQGVKYGKNTSKTVYGEWSDYVPVLITGNDNLEVEVKSSIESSWSEEKESTNIDLSSDRIKVISTSQISKEKPYCEDGYLLNNMCYSNNEIIGNLTFKEYHSGQYQIKNNQCERVMTLKNNDGKYVLTYVNCKYNKVIGKPKVDNNSYTLYTYQEQEDKEVTYYRARSKRIVTEKENDIYTNEKYEENNLPEGFVKVIGSEEVYYSYKLPTCEK